MVWFSLTIKSPKAGSCSFHSCSSLASPAADRSLGRGGLREGEAVGGRKVSVLSLFKVSDGTPNYRLMSTYCTPDNMPQTSNICPESSPQPCEMATISPLYR